MPSSVSWRWQVSWEVTVYTVCSIRWNYRGPERHSNQAGSALAAVNKTWNGWGGGSCRERPLSGATGRTAPIMSHRPASGTVGRSVTTEDGVWVSLGEYPQVVASSFDFLWIKLMNKVKTQAYTTVTLKTNQVFYGINSKKKILQ